MGIRAFFQKFMQGLKEAKVSYSLEADLRPPGARRHSKEYGEIEFSLFEVGHKTFEFELNRRAELQTGDTIALHINDEHYKDFTLEREWLDLKLRSKNGDECPNLNLGDKITVLKGSKIILEGECCRD